MSHPAAMLHAIRRCLLTVLLACTAAPAGAQKPAEGRTTFFAHAGIAWPSSPKDFSDLWRPAPSFDLGAHFEVAPNVGLGGYVTFSAFSLDRSRLREEARDLSGGTDPERITVDGTTVRALALMAQTRFQFELRGDLQPYFLFGAGVLYLTRRRFSITRPPFIESFTRAAQTAPAVDVGGGFYIALSPRLRLLFEGHFFAANTRNEGTRYFTVVTGLSLSR